MSTTTTHSPLYTVDEYFGLVEAGRLDADARVELLEGVIVEMSPQTPRHSHGIRRAQLALEKAFPGREIRLQAPFLANTRSGPEPDVAVVPGATDDYSDRHPSEALLVVEVADSSLVQDRLTKSRIYAAAGVPEYWIVNLVDAVLEVYRSPDSEARVYRESEVLDRTRSIKPLHAPAAEIAVADLLPDPREED